MKIESQTKIEEASFPMPIIWADGENDDLPGVVAAVRNEFVQFDGDIYAPGRSIAVIGRTMRLSAGMIFIGPDSVETGRFPVPPVQPASGRWVTVSAVIKGRSVEITNCSVKFDL